MSTLATAGRWAAVLAVTVFACGFIGPMVFAPESNQGPMLGIFITDPLGAIAGAILGTVIGAMNVGASAASRVFIGATVPCSTLGVRS